MSRFSAVRTQDNFRAACSHVVYQDVEIGGPIPADISTPGVATDPIYIRAMIAKTVQSEPTRAYQQSSCHKLLHTMLSEGAIGGYQRRDVKVWNVSRSESGAPLLICDGSPSDLNVSMAHSGPWIAVALATGAQVGIDVEESKPREKFTAMAKYMGWENRVKDVHGFLSHWTLWEACVKLEKSSIFNSRNAAFNALERMDSGAGLADDGPWAGLKKYLPEGVHFALAIHRNNQAPLRIKGL